VLKDLMENGSFSTNAIQFATNSDKLTATSTEIITQIADALKEDETMKLKIIGHTDGDGDAAKNLMLSKKRANAVKVKLVSLGIAGTRLSIDGKGEAVPVADNKTAEGKAQNRRVEFVKL
jgi:outer membrane protein OmpA-like peptidoglycan-associated protein